MQTEWTAEQQKEHRKLWVQALRSGDYEQGQDYLANKGLYCCLGVACVLTGMDDDELSLCGTLNEFPHAMSYFGLATCTGEYGDTSLAKMNDGGKTFSEIADIIESEPPGLFVDHTP
ncbi:hypothetical protein [Mesorhizobium sp. M4B.F.Ca.ET.143.01.1.1]|uniref:hypothetical protein n=1 Tax=Mesorhizobium sp. M4B.F.Ca.ET.143.01.1.1 TaxID=2563947 RepID=UPI00109404AC|nr:hypothetical protein [Mesorhizobium sp. M4B.F.Ca.ET.143.01.1.1]TGV26361.1 hypothetical protein EN786_12635 [Mesorhizobium sp. M4B.F.Ca.ET.143.01.1.1]